MYLGMVFNKYLWRQDHKEWTNLFELIGTSTH